MTPGMSHVLRGNVAQQARLESMKTQGTHVGNTGKGLMIEDEETVALVSRVAEMLGVSKREAVRQALERFRACDA